MIRDELQREIATARAGVAFRAYERVREAVLDMLDAAEARPSGYWTEELNGFGYLLDASPLIVERLREHCFHLTGIRPYEYRHHHGGRRADFAAKLAELKAVDRSGLWVPEPPELGGFGHDLDGLVNLDTLKFYEERIALDRAGVLAPLRDPSTRKVVVEIGAGWGGFAHGLLTLCPNTTYVIVDLPQTMLFSATYLQAMWPDATIFIQRPGKPVPSPEEVLRFDFVFLSAFAYADVELPSPALGVNLVSFQEMTTTQVDAYAGWLRRLGTAVLYSHNVDRGPYNPEMSSVRDVLARHFTLQELDVLPDPYTTMPAQDATFVWRLIGAVGRRRSRGSPHRYRHVIGS